jgi:hypothetical protein
MCITKSSFSGWPGNLLQPDISGDNLRLAQASTARSATLHVANFFVPCDSEVVCESSLRTFLARVSLTASVMVRKCCRMHLHLSRISPRKRLSPVLPHADRRCRTDTQPQCDVISNQSWCKLDDDPSTLHTGQLPSLQNVCGPSHFNTAPCTHIASVRYGWRPHRRQAAHAYL